MANKRIKDLTTSIAAFRTGDVIPVDGPSGTAKMSKDDLLAVTAQNALGSIHLLSDTATESDLVPGNYFAVDGESGSKKLPADCVAKRSVQDGLVISVNKLTKEIEKCKIEREISLIAGKKVDETGIVVGNTLTLDYAIEPGYSAIITDVAEGDVLYVKGSVYSATTVHLFAFTDESGVVLELSDYNSPSDYSFVCAPAGAKKFVFNSATVTGPSVKIIKPVTDAIDDVNAIVDDIVNDYKPSFKFVRKTVGNVADNLGLITDDSTTRFASEVLIKKEFVKTLKIASGYKVRCFLFENESDPAIVSTGWLTSSVDVEALFVANPTAVSFRLLVAKTDDSTITLSDVDKIIFDDVFFAYKLDFERGALRKDGQFIPTSTNATNEANFYGKWRTSKFIAVEATRVFFEVGAGSDAKMFQFDSGKNFISYGSVSGMVVIPPNVKYIKVISNSTEYPDVKMYLNDTRVKECFNIRTEDTEISFLFEVTPPKFLDIMESEPDFVGYDTNHYFDSGLLILPPNYNDEGEPSPLIIFNHGSGGYTRRSATKIDSAYDAYFQYLAKEGFAILDCYPASNKYGSGDSFTIYSNATPDAIACMDSAFDWAVKNYNLSKKNVFSACKSHGGVMALAQAFDKKINPKACGLLAPALSVFTGTACLSYTESDRDVVATDLHLEDKDGYTMADLATMYSAECKGYIQANEDKFVNRNPYFMGVQGTNIHGLVAKSLDKQWSDDIFKTPRNLPTPVKIWISSDDENSSLFPQAVSFYNSVRNGTGLCEFRRMPTGTGGHHSVDNAASALKVASLTTALGYVCTNVPLAYAEMVQWFRRFI